MIEVEITNYESITHTKIQIDGFTTLIGRNYLGKSSVLRAINATLTNKEGTDFISWGQNFCEVHLKFPDLDILWHKEEGNNFYKINGKDYPKAGKGEPPDEILNAGFKPITVGDKKINLNYAIQFFPLFLVDKRDSKSADILTSVYGLDRIYKAIDLCNKEQRANKDLLRFREKDLQNVNKDLERFNKFPDLSSQIPDIKKRRKELGEQESEISRIRGWVASIKNLANDTKRLKKISDVKIPFSVGISRDITEYDMLTLYKKNLEYLSKFVKRVGPVNDIVIPDQHVSSIKSMFSEYQKCLIWSSNYKKLSEDIDRLKKAKEINLPSISVDIEDIPKLKNLLNKIRTISSEVKILQVSLNEVNGDITKVEEELKSFDVCPLCGAKRE